jgi:hypothetical protein
LPNDQWGTRNRALGYLNVFPLSWLRFPLHLERALAKRDSVAWPLRVAGYLPALIASNAWRVVYNLRNNGRGKTIRVELVAESSPVFDALWEYASVDWPNIQVRDNSWVQWRYLQSAPDKYMVAVAYSPGQDSSEVPVGYVAFRVVDHGERSNGYIADLLFRRDDEGTAWSLIRFALDQLSRSGAGTVMTLAPPGTVLYATLRRFGFLPTKAETSFSFEVVPLDPNTSIDSFSNPADWHLTGGDFDVI